MPYCSNCGQKLHDEAKFCDNCGSAVKLNSSTNKFAYDGVIHKCPNCGGILESFVIKCPFCDYELRQSNVTSSVKELERKLEEIEMKRPQIRSSKITNIITQSFRVNPLSDIDEKEVNLIKNFSIPNTKEDIFEFIILASSNIDMKVYGLNSQQYNTLNPAKLEISDAWLAKLEQAYQKAVITFGNSNDFFYIKKLYESKINEIKKRKRQLPLFLIFAFTGSILFTLIIFFLIYLIK